MLSSDPFIVPTLKPVSLVEALLAFIAKMLPWRRVLGQAARRAVQSGAGRRLISSGAGHQSGWTGSAWRRTAFLGSAATLASAGAMLVVKSPARAESSEMEEEPSVAQRTVNMLGLESWFKWAREPAERGGCPPGKLLPDPMELPPGVVQRTLVLSLEDTLIHTVWDRSAGHRTRKRPGLDAFLAHMSQYYEIIIFTSAYSSYAAPIAEKLQESSYVTHALYNEHTKGDRIKDLSYLNRDLRHVILIDTNPASYRNQKYNGIGIKPWDGDLTDTELLNLVPFLEAVFKEDIQDVREVIRGMEGHNIPVRMRELKQQRAAKGGARRGGKDSGLLASIAIKAPVTATASARSPPKPAPVAPEAVEEAPAAVEAAAPAAEAVKPEEGKKKKLFQHRI